MTRPATWLAGYVNGRLQRSRTERGYIAITALGIMLLLFGTSLTLLSAAEVQIKVAREGRDFTESRQSMGDSLAQAETALNSTSEAAVLSGSSASGTLTSRAGRGRGTGTWTYSNSTRVLTAIGAVNDTSENVTAPLRGRYVGSYSIDPVTGRAVYGVAANGPSVAAGPQGVWASVLSVSSSSSVVNARFLTAGSSVSVYGDGTLSLGIANQPVRAVRFQDGADVGGLAAGYTTVRSALSARTDRELLKQKTSNANDPSCASPSSSTAWASGNTFCSSGDLTLKSGGSWSGVRTLVVKGDLYVGNGAGVNNAGSQLHIYVSGDVYFGSNAGSELNLYNTFIFAPNGTCRNDTFNGDEAILLRGALACKTATVAATSPSSSFTYVAPMADANFAYGVPTDHLFYVESPGYVDSLTP